MHEYQTNNISLEKRVICPDMIRDFFSKMREHWNSHGATYVCCFIFIITTIVISMLSWAVILRPVERSVENPERSLPVHVFINENDTIMPKMMDDLKEMKGMLEDIQSSDTLCLMITKGGK